MSVWLASSRPARERLFSILTLEQQEEFLRCGGFTFKAGRTSYFINGDLHGSIKQLINNDHTRIINTYCWHPSPKGFDRMDDWLIQPMEWTMLIQYLRFNQDPASYKAQSINNNYQVSLGLNKNWDPNKFDWDERIKTDPSFRHYHGQ